MRRTIFVVFALAFYWTAFAPSTCDAQSNWRLYDPKTALVPVEDLINGAANRMASDSMRLEWKREAIARAKYATELEDRSKLDGLIQAKQGDVLDRCVIENSDLHLRIEKKDEDLDDMRPWATIGKSVVVVGSVALLGWTTIQLLNLR